jgi:hypothetical protein
MFIRPIRRLAGFAVLIALLPGCTKSDMKAGFTGRWGPDPSLSAGDVQSVVSNQNQVLNYIILDAGLAKISPDGTFDRPIAWFQVTEWGFNVGRQDCDIYMNTLFRMNREKQRNDSMFTALGTAAAAILTSTNSGQKALSIVAAAFGMTTALNDALFQSFLFTESPGLVAIKVRSMQDAFQETIEKNQTDGTPSNDISTAAAAYSAIQNYYSLCLPQTIEGTLLQAVASTTAKTVDPGKPTNTTSSGPSTSKTPQVFLAPTAPTSSTSQPPVVKVVMPSNTVNTNSTTTTPGATVDKPTLQREYTGAVALIGSYTQAIQNLKSIPGITPTDLDTQTRQLNTMIKDLQDRLAQLQKQAGGTLK